MHTEAKNSLDAISAEFFAVLDGSSLAYVKRVEIDGETAYAVHAADGTELAILADREAAFAAAASNDFFPLSVH